MSASADPTPMPQTIVEVDLACIDNNLRALKNACPDTTRLMAVVKANAYGHGAVAVAKQALASGASCLAVARISEAAELRQAGIGAPILLFGDLHEDHVAYAAEQDLSITISSDADAFRLSQKAIELGITLKAHVKVDTGMGRLGICAGPLLDTESSPTGLDRTADDILDIVNLGNIEVEGLYTHFANADCLDKTHALHQLEIFSNLLAALKQRGFEPEIRHAANSAATMEMPQAHLNMVRTGIAMYGLWPSEEVDKTQFLLKPAMSIHSRIIHLKHVPAGFKVSYGSTFATERPSRIATVPIGYADGYSRLLSSKGSMLVRGIAVPVVGRVCMDFTMIDVTDVADAVLGDNVVILGCQGDACITADEIARLTGTINYEVVSSLTRRMPLRHIHPKE